ncbi:MAG: Ldh family oxidoreductase [Bacillota bacterium]|nr:MAG: Ldh family oxidoreductase [Bacillota bacterium]
MRLHPERTRDFVRAAFEALGATPEDALVIADYIVFTSLRGVDSHGIRYVPVWADEIRRGKMKARYEARLVRDTGAVALFHGDNGLGVPVGHRAMQCAVEKACRYGVGLAGTSHTNQLGSLAFYAALALGHGMIGMVVTNAQGRFMAPWGGRTPMIGNNPLAVAIPAGDEEPVLLDMAMSVVARGKIVLAADEGRPIPEGWATTREGLPTTDAVLGAAGLLLPIGGPKGSGLSIVIGSLCACLTGAAFDSQIVGPGNQPRNSGQLFLAIRPDAFVDPGEFRSRMDERIRELRTSEPAAGCDRVYLPGEKEAVTRRERLASGIPVSQKLVDDLRGLAAELGLEEGLD